MLRPLAPLFFRILTVVIVTQVVSTPAFCQDVADLSLPILDPKPVVLLRDWKPSGQPQSSTREKAVSEARVADRLKSEKQYGKAEMAYFEAMLIDPTWSYPAYQLACNYELSDQHQKAVTYFNKAIELGFADFPMALEDNELGKLRDASDFKNKLAEIRERYIKDAKERIGTPAAVIPEGDPPEGGWPLVLMLHGYGDSNESYLDFAKAWAGLGFVAVAVPGSVPFQQSGYVWAPESTDPTLKDLRAIVAAELISNVINKEKVFLLGFSQGALHAILLTAKYRDEFAGVVALSPGGSLIQQIVTPKISEGRPGRLVFIHGSEESHAPIAKKWSEACSQRGWEFTSGVHQGGHHFPRRWAAKRPAIAKFLTRETDRKE